MRIRCPKRKQLVDPSFCREKCEFGTDCDVYKKWMERQGGKSKPRQYDNGGNIKILTKLKIIDRDEIAALSCPRCYRVVEDHHHYCYHCGAQFKG